MMDYQTLSRIARLDTVYVVTPFMSDLEPAAFANQDDAERYAIAIGLDDMAVCELLVCDSELAAKMIADAERDQ